MAQSVEGDLSFYKKETFNSPREIIFFSLNQRYGIVIVLQTCELIWIVSQLRKVAHGPLEYKQIVTNTFSTIIWYIRWCFTPYRQYFSHMTALITIRILLQELEYLYFRATGPVSTKLDTMHLCNWAKWNQNCLHKKPSFFKEREQQNNENTCQSSLKY